MRHSKKGIERLAMTILNGALRYEDDDDMMMYFNNKKVYRQHKYENGKMTYELITKENENPNDYVNCFINRNIVTFYTEGNLYDTLHCIGTPRWLKRICERYGLYVECWDSCHWVLCEDREGDEWEYTVYKEPDPATEIYDYDLGFIPKDVKEILLDWYHNTERTPDSGSCVIGAGVHFVWNGIEYFANPSSSKQCSLSWEPYVNDAVDRLKEIGCKNVYYNAGRMD